MCFNNGNGGGIVPAFSRLKDVMNYAGQYNSTPHTFTSSPNGNTLQTSQNPNFDLTPQQYASSKGVKMYKMADNANTSSPIASAFGGALTAMGASKLIK